MAAHRCITSSCRNRSWNRRSPESSGWKLGHHDRALARRAPAAVVRRRAPRRAAPRVSMRGRADEHAGERAAAEPVDVEVGLERVALAAVARCAAPSTSMHAERLAGRAGRRATSRASRIMPAHVPSTGRPSASALGQRRAQPRRVEQLAHRRGLAAGQDQRVERAELAPACAPRPPRRRARRAPHDARGTLPAARAPRPSWPGGLTVGVAIALPAPVGELDVEGVDLLAAHRLAEPARHLGHDRRRRRSAWWPRRSPWPSCGGSALLKMPLPTNTACAPSCITSAASAGRGDAAGAEQRHGQLAALGDLLHQLDRRPQLLGPAVTARPRRRR